jgi:Fe-S-cluster containining protein
MQTTIAEHIAMNHKQFKFVEAAIFTRKLVADCMSHSCKEIKSASGVENHLRLDACCQYGADVDLFERDKILARADELRAILHPDAAAAPWFTTEMEAMSDFPSGQSVRTARFKDGCVFLQHDGRGCAIHRASIENKWDFHGTKPHICRLFPLTYDEDSILIADDYIDYSCAFDDSAPSLYRVQRSTLAGVFGDDLVALLDGIESTVLAAQPKKLPIALKE